MTAQHPIVSRFIEETGNMTQALGLARVPGQIYAYLFFSPVPRTLDDMTDELGISKGSASMCVRQLVQLGAVKRIWVKGDRKDYYTADDYFGQIIRRLMQEMVGRRVELFGRFLDQAEAQVALPKRNGNGNGNGKNGNGANKDEEFIRSRLQRLRAFQKKAERLWNNPLIRQILK